MKENHHNRLREYLEQLIASQGVLQVLPSDTVAEQVETDYLARLAFKFYRQLHGFDQGIAYSWEHYRCLNCSTSCDQVPRPLFSEQTDLPFVCPLGWNQTADLPCLNCGKRYPCPKPENPRDLLPVCPECTHLIDSDIVVWEHLFSH